MLLCSLCRKIPFDNLPSLPECFTSSILPVPNFAVRQANVWQHRPERFGFQYHPDLRILRRIAATGCPICYLVMLAANELEKVVENSSETHEYRPANYRLFITAATTEDEGFVVWTDSVFSKAIVLVAAINLSVTDDSSLAGVFRSRKVGEPGSPQTLRRIQGWVRHCNEMHHCMPAVSALPTRVIDLGEDGESRNYRLWETGGKHARYATLSHCWGNTSPLTTTRETLKERKRGIKPEQIPKTFREAIMLTRLLGIRYLWIDSLCIIQQDRADWTKEGGKMEEIYSNSYVTIAAASAVNGTRGCFTPRPARVYKSFDITTSRGISGEVFACTMTRNRGVQWTRPLALENEPLTKRAWTYQERVLSPRSIFCCHDQVYWECEKEFKGEDGYLQKNRLVNLDAVRASYARAKGDANQKIRSLGGSWDDTVASYSPRLLTNETDRLPALAGLAKRFADIYQLDPSEYSAGLWKNTLPGTLLWSHLGGLRSHWPPDPKTYSAPSWSWASVGGTATSMERYRDCPKFTKVVDVQVTVDSVNPYGQISQAKMTVRGPLVKVSVDESDSDSQGRWVRLEAVGSNSRMKYRQDLVYDISIAKLKTMRLFALVVGRDTGNAPDIFLYSLLLTPSPARDGTYMRLAFLIFDEKGMGKVVPNLDGLASTITIV